MVMQSKITSQSVGTSLMDIIKWQVNKDIVLTQLNDFVPCDDKKYYYFSLRPELTRCSACTW